MDDLAAHMQMLRGFHLISKKFLLEENVDETFWGSFEFLFFVVFVRQ